MKQWFFANKMEGKSDGVTGKKGIKLVGMLAGMILLFSVFSGCSSTPDSNDDPSSDPQKNGLEIGKQNTTIAAGGSFTVGIKNDGTVLAVGNNESGQCNVTGWTDIAAVSAGEAHTIGLKNDGTVVAAGNNDYGQCNVSQWSDIIAVSAGQYHTVGLKNDHMVVATGNNKNGQCDVAAWTDITSISAGLSHTAGVKKDHTVLASGSNFYGETEVSSWQDIVQVSAGDFCTAGLLNDGSVVFVGDDANQQVELSGWFDLAMISVGYPVIGLGKDGKAIVYGTYSTYYPETEITVYEPYEVSDWTYLVAVDAGSTHIVGLTDYGTVMALGSNRYGQCEVSQWKDMKIK